VRALGGLESAPEEVLVDVGVVRLDFGDQLLDEVFAMPLRVENTHRISVLSGVFGSFRPGRNHERMGEERPSMRGIRRWWRRRNARRLAVAMRDVLVPSR
jgi:hypothetical protein